MGIAALGRAMMSSDLLARGAHPKGLPYLFKMRMILIYTGADTFISHRLRWRLPQVGFGAAMGVQCGPGRLRYGVAAFRVMT